MKGFLLNMPIITSYTPLIPVSLEYAGVILVSAGLGISMFEQKNKQTDNCQKVPDVKQPMYLPIIICV